MLFNSYEFIFVFLPITFFVYFYLNHKRLTGASKWFLVCSSLFFYSWWNIIYLPIILTSVIINFALGVSLSKTSNNEQKTYSKKTILIFGIISNLSLLVYFKYTDFLIENFNFAFNSNTELLHLALPLAISFFTFQQIAYLIDSYRRKTKEYNFINYALFVTFFPQLIAGPIVHHEEMMPQFAKAKNKVKNYRNISAGIFIFSIGLFKKVIIADTFAVLATEGFDIATTLNLFEAWVTSLSYTFQLYFDFSGYADMAIGLALLFNINLPINFYSPYKSTSMIQLWSRWHITLTKFVTEYIFKTIISSFNKYSSSKGLLTIFISMLIIGFWHGASWMFILFGSIHGLGLVINHIWRRKVKIPINKYLGWLITFNTINLSLVLFRAQEMNDAIKVYSSMFSLQNIVLPNMLGEYLSFLGGYGVSFGGFIENIKGGFYLPLWILLGFIIILFFKNSMQKLHNFKSNHSTLLFTLLLFTASIVNINKAEVFIYFNF